MIDKAWVVIIFMYILSFTFMGVQYALADVLHFQLTTMMDVYNPITKVTIPAGTEMRPYFQGYSNYGTLNNVATRVTSGDNYSTSDNSFYDKVVTSTIAAAFIGWDVITLLSGMGIFSLLFLFGIPYIFVIGIEIVYVFFLIRTIIALIRGV